MTVSMAVRAVVLAVGLLVVTAAPASAHAGDDVGPTNYETVITSVRPKPDGLRVRSVDLSSQMELQNHTGRTVIVLGYEDEPYLRIDRRGVYINMRSPAAYLNVSRSGDNEVPPRADAEAPPRWVRSSGGLTARWHDHRAHWMATDDPPAVRTDPERRHVVIDDWQIPMTVGERRVLVTGDLTWSPSTSLVPYGLAAGLLAAALVAVYWLRRRTGTVVAAAAVLVVAAASVAQTVGVALASDMSASPVVRFVSEGGLLLGIGWVGGVIAAWWLFVSRRDDGILIAGIAGMTIFLAGGLAEVGILTKPHIGSALPEPLARLLLVLCIGLGLGLGLIAVLAERPRWLARFIPA